MVEQLLVDLLQQALMSLVSLATLVNLLLSLLSRCKASLAISRFCKDCSKMHAQVIQTHFDRRCHSVVSMQVDRVLKLGHLRQPTCMHAPFGTPDPSAVPPKPLGAPPCWEWNITMPALLIADRFIVDHNRLGSTARTSEAVLAYLL